MTDQVEPSERLMHIVYTMWLARCMGVVADLGVADHIGDDAASADDLAARLAANDSQKVRRLMDFLTSEQLFQRDSQGRYELNSVSQLLRSDHPKSLRAGLQWLCGPEHARAWGRLADAVRSEETGFELAHQASWMDYLSANPPRAQLFGRAMSANTTRHEDEVLAAHRFANPRLIVDLGGSHGRFLSRVLAAYPEAQGILFDVPSMIESAQAQWSTLPTGPRMKSVVGNFFEKVPDGADLYILKFVLHDWSDTDVVRILRNVRTAIGPCGVVAIIDVLLPEDASSSPAFAYDVNMMVMTGGCERRASDFSRLLAEAGFRTSRVTSGCSLMGVVEARADAD